MSIAECGVGEKQGLLAPNPFGKILGAQFLKFLPRSIRRGGAARILGDWRFDELAIRIDLSFHIRASVDDHIAEIADDFRRPVAFGAEAEKLGRVVDERGSRLAP